jgi:hypothetical protein
MKSIYSFFCNAGAALLALTCVWAGSVSAEDAVRIGVLGINRESIPTTVGRDR